MYAQLVALLQLPPGPSPRPAAVSMASRGRTLSKRFLRQSEFISHWAMTGLSGSRRELIDMTLLKLGPGLDIIKGLARDWISGSHDPRFLYLSGTMASTR